MRIIETDFEWNQFLKELADRKTEKVREIRRLLDALNDSKEDKAIDNCNELYRALLKSTEKPDFLKDISEKDWDIENLYKVLKQKLYAQGIELKRENQERKFLVVNFQVYMQEKKVAKATVTKIFLDPTYAKLYKNNPTALVSFFESLSIKDVDTNTEPRLAYKVLIMYEKTLTFRVLKAIKDIQTQIDIHFEFRALRRSFVGMVNGANISNGDLREIICLIGKSINQFSSGTWYKHLYYNNIDLAELINETYSLLYYYSELDNVQQALLSSKI